MNPTAPIPKRDLPKELRQVSVVKITDPTTAHESIELINQDVVNLDPEAFEVKRVTVPLEECCLLYHSSNVAVRTRTRIHKDFETCTILGPQARGSLDGMALHPFALVATGPGAQAEFIVERGYESIAWLVPPQVLDKHLALRGNKREFVFPDDLTIWHPEAEMAQRHFELGKQIAEAAEQKPEIFNDSHWARYGAQVEFMDSLFATIESSDINQQAKSDKRGKSHSHIVQACEDYTSNLEGRRPYLSELCAVANVSERTLQYAFQDIMGMPPLTYLLRLRLHWARDELRRATSGTTTVTDVAINWGFWHFGEFSRAYKNCFAEVPSATLKRNSSE